MIPNKLELTNFLSYRKKMELNFEGIQLACISGANGAGKSSILDAITWALFGRSRSRSDDDLVNRLAIINDEAAVVRFSFNLEGTTYQIVRRKRVGKAVILELQIADGNGWKTLSERKLRETQAQIEHLLRMNYDTFTNASFLLQGKADEFTTRTANQRKEILAELLGVTEWERYREAAAEKRKTEEGRLAILEARLADIEAELQKKEEREAALAKVEAERMAIAERLTLQEQLLKQVRQTAAAVEQQKLMVTNLANSMARLERNLISSKDSLQSRQLEKEEKTQVLEQEAQICADYAAWQTLEAALQSWQTKADLYNDLQQQMRPHELTLAEVRSRLEQERQGLEEQAELVQRAKLAVPALKETFEHDTVRLQEIEERLRELENIQKRLQTAQAELDKLRGQRELEEQERRRLEEQEKRMQRLAQEKSAVLANEEQATAALTSLNAKLQTMAARQEKYILAKAELDTLHGQQQPLRQEMNRLKERIERLEEAELGSECPTCGQPLSKEHRRAVLTDLQQEGKNKGDQFRGNKERISELEEETRTLQDAFQQKERLERDLQANQQRLAKAEARLSEIKHSEVEWEKDGARKLADLRSQLADDAAIKTQTALVLELRAELEPQKALINEQKELQAELSKIQARAEETTRQIVEWEDKGQAQLDHVRQQLFEEQFAQEARAALAAIEKKAATIDYDQAAHQEARNERDNLAEAVTRYQELKQAEAAVGPLTTTIAELQKRIVGQEEDLNEQKQQLATTEAQLQTLVESSSDLEETETAVSSLREEDIAAVQAVSVAQQKLDVLQDLEEQQGQLEEEKAILSTRIQQLKFLEKSCGRQGVQALLIEHALPEIEERANQLIERLTGGDMRIYFDTQRKLKTRDAMAETLDIRIEDKDGVRPYDNYSGGEQFRVNFAIRLALSQLLAHRAGARLQTLVIDEGFGSQDPQGRQRLVEAINTVRDEFACILVITHIAELRDAFSTRIEVQKTNNGSSIRVI